MPTGSRPTPEECRKLLERAYGWEVVRRGNRPEMSPVLAGRLDAVASWMTGGATRGLFLAGPKGTGKTTMLRAIAMAVGWMSIPSERTLSPVGVQVVSAQSIGRRLLRRDIDLDEVVTAYACAPLLAVDDMGAESPEVTVFGNPVMPLAEVLEERYRRNSVTILSGNLSLDMVGKYYGGRVADRMYEWMTPVVFGGESYRVRLWRARTGPGDEVPPAGDPNETDDK